MIMFEENEMNRRKYIFGASATYPKAEKKMKISWKCFHIEMSNRHEAASAKNGEHNRRSKKWKCHRNRKPTKLK